MSAKVVFIHLGSTVPKYLKKNICRTRRLFPNLEILVAGQSSVLEAIAQKVEAKYVPVSNIFGSSELAPAGLARDGLDMKFWNGYWQKTFDRLLVIAEVHEKTTDGALVHIESDVIITKDFPFDSLANSSKLMWGAFDDAADIASIVFSPSMKESRWLANALRDVAEIDNTATDMTALATIRKQNPDKIRLLAATPELAISTNQPGVVFDGLHIGEWVFGWDPKAHWGFRRRRIKINSHSESVADGNLEVRGQSLLFTSNGQVATVSNLHVHSKELRFFDADISKSLAALLKVTAQPRAWYGFVPSGFISWLASRLKRWSTTLIKSARRKIVRA